jgi:hypothetical protein
MEIILSFESSDGVPMLLELYNNLEEEINRYFQERNYGNKITRIYAGAICVSKEYENFVVVRKPKFLHKEPALEVEYILDFQTYRQMPNQERLIYNLRTLYLTINNLANTLSKKSFDTTAFLADLQDFIQKKC